jgi:hypothetical protein
MNTITSPHKTDPADVTASSEDRNNIHFRHHEVNTMEGSEFLDDAIRMKDQPLDEISLNKNESSQTDITGNIS